MTQTTWPTDWTRIPTLALRNAAVDNARKAAAECARRRREQQEALLEASGGASAA